MIKMSRFLVNLGIFPKSKLSCYLVVKRCEARVPIQAWIFIEVQILFLKMTSVCAAIKWKPRANQPKSIGSSESVLNYRVKPVCSKEKHKMCCQMNFNKNRHKKTENAGHRRLNRGKNIVNLIKTEPVYNWILS